jgi:hypothetical protein
LSPSSQVSQGALCLLRYDGSVMQWLAFASSSFSLFCSLSPNSQVSRGALGLLRYDGSGRVLRGHPDVLVSSSLSPWRHEFQVIQRMRRHACGSWAVVRHAHLHRGRGLESNFRSILPLRNPAASPPTRWPMVYLDLEKQQRNNPFHYSPTRRSRVRFPPAPWWHAWYRRVVSNINAIVKAFFSRFV